MRLQNELTPLQRVFLIVSANLEYEEQKQQYENPTEYKQQQDVEDLKQKRKKRRGL